MLEVGEDIRSTMASAYINDAAANVALSGFLTELTRRLMNEAVVFNDFREVDTHLRATTTVHVVSSAHRVSVQLRAPDPSDAWDQGDSVFVRPAEIGGEVWLEVYAVAAGLSDLSPEEAFELSQRMRWCEVTCGATNYHVRFQLPLSFVTAERLNEMMFEVLDGVEWMMDVAMERAEA